MGVPITVDIPEHLHETLKSRAEALHTSVPELVIQAIQEVYPQPRKKGKMITGPFLSVGELGPEFPADENPYDLVFP